MVESSADVSRVVIETALGKIELDLYPSAAPITVANFLHYVEIGAYDGGTFHRTVTMDNQPQNEIKIEVIQAGMNPQRRDELGSPIPLERTSMTGLRHLDGTISMGRSTPDSADEEIFICIGDQPELDFGGLRNPDGQGFAAFGQVTAGMDVVRAIQVSPYAEQTLTPPVLINRIVQVG
jgi:peptidyl-prolyl cis-trans isomerase A (cyclophilin A)